MNIEELVNSCAFQTYYWPPIGLYLAKCPEFPGLFGEAEERVDAIKDLQNQIRERLISGEKKP